MNGSVRRSTAAGSTAVTLVALVMLAIAAAHPATASTRADGPKPAPRVGCNIDWC
jgi:hypothetical protein